MSDLMFSAAFDVLIKILESYRPQIPSICGSNVIIKLDIQKAFDRIE